MQWSQISICMQTPLRLEEMYAQGRYPLSPLEPKSVALGKVSALIGTHLGGDFKCGVCI